MPVSAGCRIVPAARASRQDDRVHERRVRPAAPGPRPLSAAGPRLGDALIVGVNSDRSVRANKGPAVRSRRKPSAPRSSLRWRASMPSSSSTKTRRTRSSPRSSRTCSSRAPTGPKTPSSAATSSRRAAAASSGSRSSPAIRRPRSSRRSVPLPIEPRRT